MAFDVIHRNNGTWQVHIRLPQLKTLTGKPTYHVGFDTEQKAKRQGALQIAHSLSGLTPKQAQLQHVALGNVLGKYTLGGRSVRNRSSQFNVENKYSPSRKT